MKICLWDIETAKMQVAFNTYSRKLYSPYLPSEAIKRHIWLPCASWKTLGEGRVYSACVLDDPKRFKKCYYDDLLVVKKLHDLMHDVDVIVAHNGDQFDWKMFLARCLFHNLPPPPRPMMIDTLKVARQNFKIEANDLRYLAKYVGVEEKGQAPDWELIAIGDEKEIRKCAAYNKQDVKVLEPVYIKLRPFMKNHPNFNAVHNLPVDVCPTCASPNIQRRGFIFTRSSRKQRYQCKDCAAWCSDSRSISTAKVK